MIDIVGHQAYLLIAIGSIQIARRQRIGWLIRMGGNAGWIWIGFQLALSSPVVWETVFLAINLWGWWNWRHATISKV